jgi:hypothetical protein
MYDIEPHPTIKNKYFCTIDTNSPPVAFNYNAELADFTGVHADYTTATSTAVNWSLIERIWNSAAVSENATLNVINI